MILKPETWELIVKVLENQIEEEQRKNKELFDTIQKQQDEIAALRKALAEIKTTRVPGKEA